MKKRKIFAILGALALLSPTMWSCKSDDTSYSAVDNQLPTIALTESTILTEPGREFTIKGVVSDNDGLKSIRLQNEAMYLDKTIDLIQIYDSLLKTYNLQYSYTADDEWEASNTFPVLITVEDVLGNKQTATVTISADGDFTAPSFTKVPSDTVTVLLQNPKLKINLAVEDNKALDYVLIKSEALGINDTLYCVNSKSVSFSESYTLPAELAQYDISFAVVDGAGNSTSSSSTIKVSEMPDFTKMYLADVESADELNSDIYGVPMLIDHVGEYQYSARYYNQKAGTKVRFIPQMTDFEPICFGVDPDDSSLLANNSEASGIQLDEIAYYQIDFNIITGEYSVQTYTPDTEAMTLDGSTTVNFGDDSGDQPAQICLAGSGLPDDTPDWTTNQNNNAYILYQSTENPYLLYRQGTYTKGSTVSFTISQTHWWGWWPEPFWRFDGSDNNEANVLNGGDNMKEMTVPATGEYLFEFDYHLLRSRLIRVE